MHFLQEGPVVDESAFLEQPQVGVITMRPYKGGDLFSRRLLHQKQVNTHLR